MTTLLLLASSLCLAAQQPAQDKLGMSTRTIPSTTKPTPQTPARRAAAYKGPKVVKDTRALGTKMIRDSKPIAPPVAKPNPK
ncbi:MAG: hypothetical protein EOO36_14900 [Cytophagaceae bacterium]|nr:MAG: hypothetical protein EOO36_14900 [Cytophagaceae bacterium]